VIESDGYEIVRLAADGDVETWLDLTTGRQLVGRIRRGEGACVAPAAGLTPLLEVAAATLTGSGWSFERLSDRALTYPVHGAQTSYEGAVFVTEDLRLITAYCVFVPRVPETRRAAMLEAIARANFGLHTGAFELGLDDGILRFRDGLIVKGSELLPRMLRDVIAYCGFICDRYYEALMAVAFDGKEPGVAVGEVDGG